MKLNQLQFQHPTWALPLWLGLDLDQKGHSGISRKASYITWYRIMTTTLCGKEKPLQHSALQGPDLFPRVWTQD